MGLFWNNALPAVYETAEVQSIPAIGREPGERPEPAHPERIRYRNSMEPGPIDVLRESREG
jgi:hypothetical protein